MMACFLCCDTFTNVSQNKKKQVFGHGAMTQIGILNEWGEVEFGSKLSEVLPEEIKESHHYICDSCCKRVDNWAYYCKKAEEEKQFLLEKMAQYYITADNDFSNSPQLVQVC